MHHHVGDTFEFHAKFQSKKKKKKKKNGERKILHDSTTRAFPFRASQFPFH